MDERDCRDDIRASHLLCKVNTWWKVSQIHLKSSVRYHRSDFWGTLTYFSIPLWQRGWILFILCYEDKGSTLAGHHNILEKHSASGTAGKIRLNRWSALSHSNLAMRGWGFKSKFSQIYRENKQQLWCESFFSWWEYPRTNQCSLRWNRLELRRFLIGPKNVTKDFSLLLEQSLIGPF